MPRSLLPAVYREASALLIENPEQYSSLDGYDYKYACGAIEKALKNRMAKKGDFSRFSTILDRYLSFLFQVYAPEKIHGMRAFPIWDNPKSENVNPRKFGLLFLANLLDSGITPKDFLDTEPEIETE